MTDPKSEPSEQGAFEAWYGFEEANHVAAWERDEAGGYHAYHVQIAWEAWQARAALTPAPTQPALPTLTDAQCDAILAAVDLALHFRTETVDGLRALIRAAAGAG